MDALALALYAAFFVLAFGWRSWAQWRRTGDTGLRLHAQPGSVQYWAKLGFVGAIVAGVAAPVAGLLGLAPIDALDRPAVDLAGLVLAVGGIVATLAAQRQMGNSWRVGVDGAERTDLVTGGVFETVRNPIFTAMVVAAGGLAAMVGNVVAVLGLAGLIGALHAQVRLVEEPYLRRVHGASYEAYSARAGRFVPLVGRLR
jgi:protein-S-isoprenylcysteine O-methyltransferase Ste14